MSVHEMYQNARAVLKRQDERFAGEHTTARIVLKEYVPAAEERSVPAQPLKLGDGPSAIVAWRPSDVSAWLDRRIAPNPESHGETF